MRHIAWLFIIASAAALTGCSYEYEIQARMIEGRLAFVPMSRWFQSPTCVRAVSVETDSGPTAKVEPGDDVRAVNRGVYWEEWLSLDSCENKFPLFYGAELAGPKFIFEDGTSHSVKAKPLVRGVVYSYLTLSDGSGGGGGKFRISEDGKVINFSSR